MYPFRRPKKTLVVIIALGFLGSFFLSIWKIDVKSAQAYFPQDEVNAGEQSNLNRGDSPRIPQDISIQTSVVDVRLSPGANDAEERINDGFMYLDSSDLELVYDPGVLNGIQSVGLRFSGVNIPQGSTITQAYVEFEVDETSSETTSLVFYGQAADNPAVFSTSTYNVTSRPKTAASVSWTNIPAWATVGAKVQSPDLAGIIQSLISRAGWASGNSLVLIIEGSGRRVATAYEAGTAKAPLLHVAFLPPSSGPTPTPPPATPTPPPATPTPTALAPEPSATPTEPPPGNSVIIDARVAARSDDAEQRVTDGRMYLTSNDLELVYDPTVAKADQSIGMRFNNLSIPPNSTILQAYLEFDVNAASNEATSLRVYGQASDNAAAFTKSNFDLTSRPKTASSVNWDNVSAWTSVGTKVQSPDISGVIQEVVDRNGWREGNSIAIFLEGSGRRVAASYEASASRAPLLKVVYLPLISASTATPTPPPSGPLPVGQTGNWNMVFSDEFNGSSLDTSKWRTCFWWADVTCTIESNHEMELYNPQDVLVQNGLLRLRAQRRDMVAWNGTTYHYTSGMVMTGGRGGSRPTPPGFSFLYGFAEALVKVPAGQGLWPAFWTLSMSYSWPPEIDIMEILGHETNRYHMNYHYVGGNAGTSWVGPDFSAGWHVLGVDWEPNAIVWYVDGVERWRYTDAAHITNEVSYLLLNLAVGGDWPGPPNGNTPFPSYYDVDYVRVWQH